MVLDINLFREEKGGNPELIRKSQRDRYKNEGLVDEIIKIDTEWRQGFYMRFRPLGLLILSFSDLQDRAAEATKESNQQDGIGEDEGGYLKTLVYSFFRGRNLRMATITFQVTSLMPWVI